MSVLKDPALRLHLVCGLFAMSGTGALLAIPLRSAWSTGLLAIPIAVGLLMRRPAWRRIALFYLWFQVVLLILVPAFYLLSGQRLVLAGPWDVAPGALGVLLLMLGLALASLNFVAIQALRSSAIVDLFRRGSAPPEA